MVKMMNFMLCVFYDNYKASFRGTPDYTLNILQEFFSGIKVKYKLKKCARLQENYETIKKTETLLTDKNNLNKCCKFYPICLGILRNYRYIYYWNFA